jgi:hypothetical protein
MRTTWFTSVDARGGFPVVTPERVKVRFPSGDTECAAWHYSRGERSLRNHGRRLRGDQGAWHRRFRFHL